MPSLRPAQFTVLLHLFGLSLASNELFARQAVTSYSPAETTACVNLAQSCFPTVASCTPAFCTSCAAVGGSDFVSCCAGTDAAGCISTLLATVEGTTVATDTAAAATTTPNSNDPNVVACRLAVTLVESCASATPGFSSMSAIEQASCLCYTSSGTQTVYAPSVYDNAQSGCVYWAKTADTSDYPLFASVQGLCTGVGNVRSASAAGTTTASGSGAAATTSQISNGGAVSTRTATMTSTASSGPTGSVVTTSSSGVAAAGFGQVQHNVEAPWGLGYLILGLGWLV